MKSLCGGLAVMIVAVAGCNKSNSGGLAGEEFKLSAPGMATTIKQGDTQTVTVTVKKDKNFKQDVALKAKAPEGLTVKLGSAVVKAADDASAEIRVKIAVAKDASVGEHTITVTGTPDKGNPTSVDITVKVDKA
jgi:uncharacterized membrane protein